MDSVDPAFATYVVGPIASVLFQDLVFWDDGQSRVNAADFGPDGVLVTGGEDGRVVHFEKLRQTERQDLGAGAVRLVAVRPGRGGEVAVGLSTGEVWLVEIATGNPLASLPRVDGEPTALGFDPTGTELIIGSSGGTVWAWPPGRPARTLYRDPGAPVRALAVDSSTTATRVAFAGRRGEIFVLPLSGGEPERLSGQRRGVGGLAFGPGGVLASGGDDGRVLLHRLGGRRAEEIATGDAVFGLGFSGNRVVVGRQGAVQVLEPSGDRWVELRSLKAPVLGFALDPSGQSVAVTRDQGKAIVFSVETGQRLATLAAHATEVNLPVIVVWLMLGAVFFTLRFGFVNLRAFGHAIEVTRGKYDVGHSEGDVSHFQALAMALSATVGLGNIAGVAIAVGTGGPGAVFWMIVAGFLGMSSKFAECTLGQMYRTTDSRGKVSGGPMHYLHTGLSELSLPRLGKVLSVLFAILCIGGSFGGGNMFQANQSYAQVASVFPMFQGEVGALVYGLLLSGLVGIVLIGGIDRIGQVASLIVPFMVGIYLIAAAFIVVVNAAAVPAAIADIVTSAFSPGAAFGGAIGVMVTGFRRAAFSNEAGVGSASIAHSAAATKEPVREGIVALLEPFIDTIVVCTTTALVLVITGAYETEADGVVMTSRAFATVIPWFPAVLTLAVFLFAFSTMISWSYYGERCWGYLFGDRTTLVYKVLFVIAVVIGAVVNLRSVLDFSDLMILGMAFPNMLGGILLSGKVRARLTDYMQRLRSGAMPRAR